MDNKENYDIRALAPALDGHPKLVNWLLHALSVDKVNAVHAKCCDTPGPEFVRRLLLEEFKIKLRIDGREVLDNLPEGAFITVSNHPFGALDGIALIYLISQHRPEYKVMVNMILNKISAMRPNFIAVDAHATDDPKKKAVSMQGIRECIKLVREGAPVGFFPAGAVGKVNWRGRLQDRLWQPTIITLIQKMKEPVVPVFFHGSQSWWFNFLGVVCWQARTLRHPAEVFRKKHATFKVTFGNPISVEEQQRHQGSLEEFGLFLREQTYSLRDRHDPEWSTLRILP